LDESASQIRNPKSPIGRNLPRNALNEAGSDPDISDFGFEMQDSSNFEMSSLIAATDAIRSCQSRVLEFF